MHHLLEYIADNLNLYLGNTYRSSTLSALLK